MNLPEIIEKRRAYIHLKGIEITRESITQLIKAAQLAPSCFNNQPWRYVFVTKKEKLQELHEAYSRGNDWAQKASLVIAVYTKEELDCIVKTRKYYLFDTGLATGFIILQATEMGLVAHPIAGFSPKKVKRILSIPEDMDVITLVIVGKHDDDIEEEPRPERKTLDQIAEIV